MIEVRVDAPNRTFRLVLDLDAASPNEATVLRFLQGGLPYEPDVSGALLRILRPGDTFVDVGANLGYFSVLAGHLVTETGRVISVEPDPRNLDRLCPNLYLNGLTHATVVRAAAGSVPGEARFFLNQDDSGGSALWDPGLFPGNDRSIASRTEITVPVRTLDDVLRDSGAAPPRLIKIDTEGAEHNVLQGALGTLRYGSVPYVIAELHPFGLNQLGSSQAALRGFMAEFGYETFALYFNDELPKFIPRGTRLDSDAFVNLLFCTQTALAEAWPEVMFDPLASWHR